MSIAEAVDQCACDTFFCVALTTYLLVVLLSRPKPSRIWRTVDECRIAAGMLYQQIMSPH